MHITRVLYEQYAYNFRNGIGMIRLDTCIYVCIL